MNGQLTKYFLLLLIINDLIQAVPKNNLERKKAGLNHHLNNLLLQKINQKSRKQGNHAVRLSEYEDEMGYDGVLHSSRIVDEYGAYEGLDNENYPLNDIISTDQQQLHEIKPLNSPDNTKKFKNRQSRALQVGDTITPEELLVVTRKLLQKVKKRGKGIVSESKNEYELADRIFERYFMTEKRIIDIKDYDIDGLDALQALSLDGDIVNYLRSSSESFTDGPTLMFRGFRVDPGVNLYGSEPTDFPKKCHYKVLRKWVEEKAIPKNKGRRKAINLKKTLGKNRKLVINPKRRKLAKMIQQNKNYSSSTMAKDNAKLANIPLQRTNDPKTNNQATNKWTTITNSTSAIKINVSASDKICRWKYQCANEAQLRTCRLHVICSDQPEYKFAFLIEEPDENLRKFREIVGISPLDEKVEKIIESHTVRIKPQKMRSKNLEDLIHYFNKIVAEDGFYTTTPMTQRDPDKIPHPLNAEAADSGDLAKANNMDEEHEAVISDPLVKEDNDDDLEARRILGLIPDKKEYKYFTTETPSNSSKT